MGEQEDFNETRKTLAEAEGADVYTVKNNNGDILNLSIKQGKFQVNNPGEENKMGEQVSIEGVVNGGNGGYSIQMPAPVTPHKPLANVDPDTRNVIEGKQREYGNGAKMNQASLQQTVEATEVDLKDLSYRSKGFLSRQYLKVAYALHMTDPLTELQKTRDDVEGRISVDEDKIKALDERMDSIDKMLDGVNKEGKVIDKRATRKMMKSAEALYLEYETDLKNEESQLEIDRVNMKAAEDRYYQITEDTPEAKAEQQQLVEAYHAFEQAITEREAKIKDLKDNLANVSRKYNTYFANVARAEGFKAKVEKQKESLLQDKGVLEGISYDLQFLLNMADVNGSGAVAITTLILDNQSQVEQYHGLIDGLEKISQRQDEIVDRLPDIIQTHEDKVEEAKTKDNDKLNKNKEAQIELARQRIKKRQGLSL